MSSWADVSSAVAGTVVFILGALVPRFIAVAELWMDRLGNSPAATAQPSPASPPSPPSVPPEPPDSTQTH